MKHMRVQTEVELQHYNFRKDLNTNVNMETQKMLFKILNPI